MDTLMPEQIKEQIERAFPPHRSAAEIYDYGERIRFEVSAKNGHVLATSENLLVRDAENPGSLANILHEVKDHVDRKAGNPVGLDDMIRVHGQKTTIRKEHAANRTREMRPRFGAVIGKDTTAHCVLIEGQDFVVSAANFDFLFRGGPSDG